MKKIFLVFTVLIICLSIAANLPDVYADDKIDGDWFGSIVFRHGDSCPGHWTPIKIHFLQKNNTIEGSIDYPSADAFNRPLEKIALHGDDVRFERTNSSGNRITFQGTRQKNAISGDYFENDNRIGSFQLAHRKSITSVDKPGSGFGKASPTTRIIKSFAGLWQGGVVEGDDWFPIRIYFLEEGNELRVMYEAPKKGVFDLLIHEIHLEAGLIHLKHKTPSGIAIFLQGKMEDGQITGNSYRDATGAGVFQLIRSNSHLTKYQKVPEFEVDLLDNEKTLANADLSGRYYLLDFWATWCPPCVDAMPDLHAAFKKYKDRNFAMISLSLDKNADIVRTFRKNKWQMPWLNAHLKGGFDNRIAKALEVRGVPTMFLVSPDGVILATDSDLAGDGLAKTLDRYLGTK